MNVGDLVTVLVKIRDKGEVIDCRWAYGKIAYVDWMTNLYQIEYYDEEGVRDFEWFMAEDIKSVTKVGAFLDGSSAY